MINTDIQRERYFALAADVCALEGPLLYALYVKYLGAMGAMHPDLQSSRLRMCQAFTRAGWAEVCPDSIVMARDDIVERVFKRSVTARERFTYSIFAKVLADVCGDMRLFTLGLLAAGDLLSSGVPDGAFWYPAVTPGAGVTYTRVAKLDHMSQ